MEVHLQSNQQEFISPTLICLYQSHHQILFGIDISDKIEGVDERNEHGHR